MLQRGFKLSDVIDALKTATPVPAGDSMAYSKGGMRVIVRHQTGTLKTIETGKIS
jgi:hypothetical protein